MVLKLDMKKMLLTSTACFLIPSSGHSQIADFPPDTVAGIPANYT